MVKIFKISNSPNHLRHPLQEVSVTLGAHAGFSVQLMEEEQVSSRFRLLRRNGQPVEAQHFYGQPNPYEQARVQAQRDRGMAVKAQTRQDGWMEILLGEFYNEEGHDEDVAMSVLKSKSRLGLRSKENILGS